MCRLYHVCVHTNTELQTWQKFYDHQQMLYIYAIAVIKEFIKANKMLTQDVPMFAVRAIIMNGGAAFWEVPQLDTEVCCVSYVTKQELTHLAATGQIWCSMLSIHPVYSGTSPQLCKSLSVSQCFPKGALTLAVVAVSLLFLYLDLCLINFYRLDKHLLHTNRTKVTDPRPRHPRSWLRS
jgi:hypothetical protein